MALILDTGPLYALADRSEPEHKKIKKFFAGQKEILILPWVIVPELSYLLQSRLGVRAEQAFLDSINHKELAMEGVHDKDLLRAREILTSYPHFGLVDATVMAMAERLNIKHIVTFDYRDYQSFRPRHCDAFVLLP